MAAPRKKSAPKKLAPRKSARRKSAPKETAPKQTAPKRRTTNERASASKRRREDEVLTVGDLPFLVKTVVDSLPGPSTRRNASEENNEEDGLPTSRGTILVL